MWAAYIGRFDLNIPQHRLSLGLTLHETHPKYFDVEFGEVSVFTLYKDAAHCSSDYEEWEVTELVSIEHYPKEKPGKSHLKVKYTDINTDFNI